MKNNGNIMKKIQQTVYNIDFDKLMNDPNWRCPPALEDEIMDAVAEGDRLRKLGLEPKVESHRFIKRQ
jgi:hypothetical protein